MKSNGQEHLDADLSRITSTETLTDAQRHQILVEWNATQTAYPLDKCLHHWIEDQVDRTPDAIAVEFADDSLTYRELDQRANQLAHYLQSKGIKPDTLVGVCVERSLEMVIALLGILKAGAAYVPLDPTYPTERLAFMVEDAQTALLLTQQHLADLIPQSHAERIYLDSDWATIATASNERPETPVAANNLAYMIYTSGSTGKPKGVLHSTGGYLLHASMTHKYIFDVHDDDSYWCTADIGWVTGHSYMVYGPLCNGATTLMFEGIPTYPDASRFWQVIDKHRVSIFYTAPTAIRALMAQGDEFVTRCSRQSLRILGSVGEPINPEAWEWYYHVVGNDRCPIVDTWWQTETGGILITPLPGAIPLKPGSATLPFFGVKPEIMDNEGRLLEGTAEGILVISRSWPGQARTVYGDHQRFIDTYFKNYPGYYFTGDGARRDQEGYFWITGRVDDVINVSGHRMGTAEFESALATHPGVAESAVVGYPHDLKGQGVWAFVVLQPGTPVTPGLEGAMNGTVRQVIGAHARVDRFQIVPGLPKTRSGKVMRRILRKVAEGLPDQLGDVSTLADPSVVDAIVRGAAS